MNGVQELDKFGKVISEFKELKLAAKEGGETEKIAKVKNKWQYMKEWHDKRVSEIFNNPQKGKALTGDYGTRYYDASYKGKDIEYKSSNFNKGPRTEVELKHMQDQINKDIKYFNDGLSNTHWHFEHNPNVAEEMKPLLKQLDDAGITWSWGSNKPF